MAASRKPLSVKRRVADQLHRRIIATSDIDGQDNFIAGRAMFILHRDGEGIDWRRWQLLCPCPDGGRRRPVNEDQIMNSPSPVRLASVVPLTELTNSRVTVPISTSPAAHLPSVCCSPSVARSVDLGLKAGTGFGGDIIAVFRRVVTVGGFLQIAAQIIGIEARSAATAVSCSWRRSGRY